MATPTLLDILNKTADYFKSKGIESFMLDAQLILGHVLKMERVELYLNYDRPLSPAEVESCRMLVRRRGAREPLQHLLGICGFRTFTLKTDKRALIPRKETELVVDEALKALQSLNVDVPARVLDVGVGAGPIALSIMKEASFALVQGVDISSEALDLARENAALNGITLGSDTFRQGDMFSPFPVEDQWHLIVSNPPYIPLADISSLQPEVRDWDPHTALAGGVKGTEFMASLIYEATLHLFSGGKLILEIGCGQAEDVSIIARECGFGEVRLVNDYSGIPRCAVFSDYSQ